MANLCPLCGRDINLVGIAHRCVLPPPDHFVKPMRDAVAVIERRSCVKGEKVNRLSCKQSKREDKGQK